MYDCYIYSNIFRNSLMPWFYSNSESIIVSLYQQVYKWKEQFINRQEVGIP